MVVHVGPGQCLKGAGDADAGVVDQGVEPLRKLALERSQVLRNSDVELDRSDQVDNHGTAVEFGNHIYASSRYTFEINLLRPEAWSNLPPTASGTLLLDRVDQEPAQSAALPVLRRVRYPANFAPLRLHLTRDTTSNALWLARDRAVADP